MIEYIKPWMEFISNSTSFCHYKTKWIGWSIWTWLLL